MPATRRVRVTFTSAKPLRDPTTIGVLLTFRPLQARLDVDEIEDLAILGPALDLAAVDGLGKILRILRAARIAPPDGADLIDREDEAVALLERALGTVLALEIRPRSRMRFTAWTEAGVEVVEDVVDVLEEPDAYLVMRKKGRFPVRVPRDQVIRQRTDMERWYEVTSIERG